MTTRLTFKSISMPMTTSKPSFGLSAWKTHFTGNSVSETALAAKVGSRTGTLTVEFKRSSC